MAFTSKLNQQGNYEVFQDGQRIATGTEGILSQYGLTPTNPSNLPVANPNINFFPITPSLLAPTPELKPIPQKEDTTNYNAIVAGGQGTIGANVPTTPTPAPVESDLNTKLDTLMKSLGSAPEKLADTYITEYNAAGIQTAQQEASAKQAKVRSAQAELAGIQAQLQGVVSKRDVNNLRLEGQASAGQVTGAILSRQQQENNRQAAIEALPLQAVALAKQAEVAALQGEAEFAQSTLKIAQDKLDTAFKLKIEDNKNAYDYAKEQRKAIYDFLTEEQKTRAAAKQKQDDRDYGLLKDQINYAQTLSKFAMDAGQSELAAKITQLDPTSSAFNQDLTELQRQIQNPQAKMELEQTRLENILKERQIAGVGELPTKETVKEEARRSAAFDAILAAQDKVDLINKIISHPSLSKSVGPIGLVRAGVFGALGGGKADFIADVNLLIQKETLDTLINLKKAGGTLGALSEGEGRMLREAASKIGSWAVKDENENVIGFKANEKSFIAEMNRLKDLANRALARAAEGGRVLGTDEKSALDEFFSTTPTSTMNFNPAGYF